MGKYALQPRLLDDLRGKPGSVDDRSSNYLVRELLGQHELLLHGLRSEEFDVSLHFDENGLINIVVRLVDREYDAVVEVLLDEMHRGSSIEVPAKRIEKVNFTAFDSAVTRIGPAGAR